MKRLVVWMLFGFTLILAGCNTMAGIGEDVETAGEEIEEEAKD